MTDQTRPFIDHIEEFRRRLIVVLVFFFGFFIAGLKFVDRVIDWLAVMTSGFVFLAPTEALWVRLKISLVMAVFATLPVVMFEAWRFVAVALTPKEKKWLLAVLPVSYLLFLAGVLLGGGVVLPAATKILLGFETEHLAPLISIDRFVGFAGWLLAAFGLMFQLPLVVIVFVKLGIVSTDQLSRARPYVVVGLAIGAALMTPGPDVFSQILLFIPTYILFELSLLVCRWTK